MHNCTFCKIINGSLPSYKIYEDLDVIVFLDIKPTSDGHTLIVPKQQIDYIFDMEDKDLGDMFIFAKKTAIAIKKNIPCEKVGIAVIGLEVSHAHIHLVPINGVYDIDFSREKLKLSPERFSEIAEMLRDSANKLIK